MAARGQTGGGGPARAARALLLAGALGLAALALAPSCSGPERIGSQPAGGGGNSSSASSSSTGSSSSSSSSSGTASGTGGAVPCGLPGGDCWDKDSTFHPVAWPQPPGCGLEVADDPTLAVPPLEWEPCPWGQPGCERMAVKWESLLTPKVAMVSVLPVTGGLRASMALTWKEMTAYNNASERAAIYDVDGTPMAVWRSLPDECTVMAPVLAPSRAWLVGRGITSQSGVQYAYVPAGYDELSSASQALPLSTPSQGTHASDELLTLWGYAGVTLTIFDLGDMSAQTYGPTSPAYFPAYQQGYPVGDHVLTMCLDQFNQPKECIWSRSTKSMDYLLAPPGQVVPFAATDGQTLVWAQVPIAPPANTWPPGSIWTSPYATSAAALQPAERCATPPDMVTEEAIVGGGYFAMTHATHDEIYIYRLSDMHRWVLPAPPVATNSLLRELVYLDETELWYTTGYLNRQKLDTLGPGAPCTPP